ncbi:MAG: glycoside hydrolase, partial [Ignavibacteria bacterium]
AIQLEDASNATVVGADGTILRNTTGGVTWIENPEPSPTLFHLEQNYPNPFNPTTTIQYTLLKPQRVALIVRDLYGREVQRLLDGVFKDAGSHHVQFDAAGLPSGVYFYSLIAGRQRQTRKMVVLR